MAALTHLLHELLQAHRVAVRAQGARRHLVVEFLQYKATRMFAAVRLSASDA